MTLSEAIKANNKPLAERLLMEALGRFAEELAEEHYLRRVHEMQAYRALEKEEITELSGNSG